MAAQYPSNLVTTSQLPDTAVASSATLGGTFDHATVHNQLADELIAVETELGVLPKGAWADVKTRLNAADDSFDMVVPALQALGATHFLAMEAFPGYASDQTNTITLTDQRLTGSAMMVKKTMTGTGVMVRIPTTAGTSLASYCGAALYSMDAAGQWNFIIDTGAHATTLFSSTGNNTQAFSSPVTLSPGVVYYAAIVAHFTGTAPVLQGLQGTLFNGTGEATYFRNGGVGTRTTRANTNFNAASLTTFTNVPWVGVYT